MSIKAQNENEEMVSELKLSNNSTPEQYGGKVDPEGSSQEANRQPVLTTGDSIKEISKIQGLVQTWIIDPPYNIGYNYGENFNDNNPNYPFFISNVMSEMFKKTKEGGSAFFIHYPIDVARLLPIIEGAGWNVKQWISWVYPANFGHSKKKFTTAHRTVLWLYKGDEPFFNHIVKGQFKNLNDKRIKKRIELGKAPALYDWMEIDLVKGNSKEHAGYFNQIPEKLLKILILNTSSEGDLIGDPCAGSCSTLKVALKNQRKAWGCDLNPLSKEIMKEWISQNKEVFQ